MQNQALNTPRHRVLRFLSHFPLLSTRSSPLPTEGDYLSVRGAVAVAAKYMAAINVLAGWAILPFSPRAEMNPPHLSTPPHLLNLSLPPPVLCQLPAHGRL